MLLSEREKEKISDGNPSEGSVADGSSCPGGPNSPDEPAPKSFLEQCREHWVRVVLLILVAVAVFMVPVSSAPSICEDSKSFWGAFCAGLANAAGVVSVAAAWYSICQALGGAVEMWRLLRRLETLQSKMKTLQDHAEGLQKDTRGLQENLEGLTRRVEGVAEVAKRNHEMLVETRLKNKVKDMCMNLKPDLKHFGGDMHLDSFGRTDDKSGTDSADYGGSRPEK